MVKKLLVVFSLLVVFANSGFAQGAKAKDRNPLIVIPGIMGSSLIDSKTKVPAWVRLSESEGDDLSLPISPNLASNKDNIIAGDIIEKVKVVSFLPGISVYDDLLKFLDKKALYTRGNWDKPELLGYKDTFYVFAYDWRRDNVENARLLFQRIEKLKAKLNKPELKFDILAHSMGGIIARYAAMYGDQDLQAKPNPNWPGVKHFNKLVMLGTPNEGAMNALDSLYNGYSLPTPAGRIYPSFLNRKVGFTIPALFQLLPHGKSVRFFDEALKPLEIDIYDPKNWEKYRWSYLQDEKLTQDMPKKQRIQAEKYLEATLARTKRFHEALDVKSKVPESIEFYAYGSDCKNTLASAILYFDGAKKIWKTQLRGDGFKASDGEKVAEKRVEETIFASGDGTVTARSFLAQGIAEVNGQDLFAFEPLSLRKKLVCESHVAIPNNKAIQEEFMAVLSGAKKEN